MKIAISSNGKDLKSNISEVFARCPYFFIAEIENGKIQKTEAIENIIANQMVRAAGISVAQFMAEKNIEAIITKNVGPRALNVLNQFGIDIYIGEGTVEKALQEFINGELKKIEK